MCFVFCKEIMICHCYRVHLASARDLHYQGSSRELPEIRSGWDMPGICQCQGPDKDLTGIYQRSSRDLLGSDRELREIWQGCKCDFSKLEGLRTHEGMDQHLCYLVSTTYM